MLCPAASVRLSRAPHFSGGDEHPAALGQAVFFSCGVRFDVDIPRHLRRQRHLQAFQNMSGSAMGTPGPTQKAGTIGDVAFKLVESWNSCFFLYAVQLYR